MFCATGVFILVTMLLIREWDKVMQAMSTDSNQLEQEISATALLEQNEFFDSEHLKADLMYRSIRGGCTVMITEVIRLITLRKK